LTEQSTRPNALLSLIVWLMPNSALKQWILRRMGHQIGENVTLKPNIVINCGLFRFDDGAILHGPNVIRNTTWVEKAANSIIGRFNQFSAAPEYQQFSDLVGVFRLGEYSLVTNRHYLDCSGQIIMGATAPSPGCDASCKATRSTLSTISTRAEGSQSGQYSVANSGSLLLKDAVLPPHSVLAAGAVLVKPRDGAECPSR
jgi:hypothetical protein